MNINEKLNLQQQLGGIVLFREGVFLRAYNESVYILTELLGHNLKIRCQPLKQNHNKRFLMCAFPVDKLSERLPEAVITDFGGQLAGDFDIKGYLLWMERRCREESEANAGAKAGNESLKTYELSASELPPLIDENLIDISLSLTIQQATYLLNWQRGHYPIEVDLGFIESLQTKLVFSNG